MAIFLYPFGICALLAILYQLNLVRTGAFSYGLVIATLGLFAGLRFETGADWEPYEDYFNSLGSFDPLGTRFEVGYYLLNWGVKSIGGSYSVVFLLASIFCAYSIYRLTSRYRINQFYILSIYIGYSFLILHFAQVRQSLAIGCFLLGFDYYLRSAKKLSSVLIALAGALFQISALMYVVMFIVVYFWPRRKIFWWVIVVPAAISMYALKQLIDVYSLLEAVSPTSAKQRLEVYRELQTDQSIFQVAYAVYLLALAVYFSWYSSSLKQEQLAIVRYAIVSLALTALFAFVLSGSYVFYSRAYAVACLFQGFAAAIIFSSKKGWIHASVFTGSLLVAAISYWRFLTLYADEFTPYHIIFETF